jgi:Surface antigen variable number repeat
MMSTGLRNRIREKVNPRTAFLAFALLLLLPCCSIAQVPNPNLVLTENQLFEESHKINKINVDAYDLFDPRIPAYRHGIFEFLNKFHFKTNDSFIRRELLLREGDPWDPDLAEQSERNLRQYGFFTDVDITPVTVGSNIVDVKVHTEDQWSLRFDISAGKSAGLSTYHFSVEEGNFLGLGKTVGIGYEQGPERSFYGVFYSDPQFLNSRLTYDLNLQKASDGWRTLSDVIRPFYSVDTRWGYGVMWDSGSYTTQLHYKGQNAAEIDTDHRSATVYVSRAWGPRYHKTHFGFLFDADNLLYPEPARIILPEASSVKAISKNLHPVNREGYLFGGLFKMEYQHFVEQTYLDNFGKVEDYPNGLQWATIFGPSQNVTPDTPNYFALHTLALYGHEFNPSQYMTLQAEFLGWRQNDGTYSNVILNAYAHYYAKLPEFSLGSINFPRQTFAANLSTSLSKNPIAPYQVSLGEDEGLRGYTFKSFTGQNKLLLNLEDRVFTPLDFHIIGIGFAYFMDAGYAWSSDQHLSFDDFGLSVGAGLRIGLKKSQSAKVIRVDLAFPLHKNPGVFGFTQQKGYSISVASGQIFEVIQNIPKLFTLF